MTNPNQPAVDVGSLPALARAEEFALILGVDYRTVQRYIAAGMPHLGRHKCAKIVDVRGALLWLDGKSVKRRGRPRNVDTAGTASKSANNPV